MSDGNEILSAETVGKNRLLRMEALGSSNGSFTGNAFVVLETEGNHRQRNQKDIKGFKKSPFDRKRETAFKAPVVLGSGSFFAFEENVNTINNIFRKTIKAI